MSDIKSPAFSIPKEGEYSTLDLSHIRPDEFTKATRILVPPISAARRNKGYDATS